MWTLLKKRMPVIVPPATLRNFMPNSTPWDIAAVSVSSESRLGNAELFQKLAAHWAVVKDQTISPARLLPEASVTPPAPPDTVAV